MRIERALLSVWDKSGLEELGRGLAELGVELLATGGTLRRLREAGLEVTAVEEITGHPEMMDGRVKTLHPAIHAGILAREGDLPELDRHGYRPIGLVVVDLYPFERAREEGGRDEEALAEMIDIGGPTMLRAAAKNWKRVAAVCRREDYAALLDELRRREGGLSEETRRRLAAAAFEVTSRYDRAVSAWLSASDEEDEESGSEGRETDLPERLRLDLPRARTLRYGENPHQAAALYRDDGDVEGVAGAEVLQGKPLSYNNLLDADGAWALLAELAAGAREPTAVVVKHLGPCGAARAVTLDEALERALATDPVSAFGGVMAFSREVDAATAERIVAGFYEIVLAPGYSEEARSTLAAKEKLRLLRTEVPDPARSWQRLRSVAGGLLVQEEDAVDVREDDLRVVTERRPDEAEWQALRFAWRVCKHVRSNAIVFAGEDRTLGIGGGQPNRVGAAELAVRRAAAHGLDLRGSAVASDAFFPFRDGVDVSAEAGATCIIQPGGSIRDEEVVAAADEHGLAMVFTGVRHFRH